MPVEDRLIFTLSNGDKATLTASNAEELLSDFKNGKGPLAANWIEVNDGALIRQDAVIRVSLGTEPSAVGYDRLRGVVVDPDQ